MPIFEYHCSSCGEQFEELVSAGSEAAVPCPSCGAAETEKQMSTFASSMTGGGSLTPAPAPRPVPT